MRTSRWRWLAICCTGATLASAGCAGAGSGGGGDDNVGDDAPGDPDGGADFDAPPGSPPDAFIDEEVPDAEVIEIPDANPLAPDATPLDPNVIDNLDDGNDQIVFTGARRGSWYTYHDETVGGVMTPSDTAFTLTSGGPPGSLFYVKTTGHGFTEWGAGVGFDINTADGATMKGKFNASSFTGISFKAKGNAPIRFSVQIAAVLETTLGGTCVPSMVAGQECDDVHGKSIALTTSWQEYQVPFSQLTQEGWGKPAAFDKATTTAVMFQIAPSITFDISIDEVKLY